MIKEYFNIPVCAELLALLAAIVCLKNKRQPLWRLLIPFLATTLAVEAAGTYFETDKMYAQNHILYNGFMLVQASLYLALFYRLIPVRNIKALVFTAAILFAATFITDTILSPYGKYRMHSRMMLSCVVALGCCVFYYALLRREDVRSPLRHPPFWIITGLFFYYFVSLPLFAFYERVSAIRLTDNITVYDGVISTLNIILYGCWITAFIWKKREP